MKNVLILGAGKSSTVLIEYALNNAAANDWMITVGDRNLEAAQKKINGHARGKAIEFNAGNISIREKCVREHDLIISLLPASLHLKIAVDCIVFKKNFITASYVSDEIKALHADAVKNGIILLNECGLDPGIDHMSAMRLIHSVKNNGGKITLFESYTGGLIAPESDTNLWHYKFTWNPRNVVLAGQGTAKFLWNNAYKYIPYQKLFSRYDILHIDGYGEFEGYPNRDSLQYREIYDLHYVQTMVRGTLRRRGFCDAWNVFVQLGITDDTYIIENIENYSWQDFMRLFLPSSNVSVENNLRAYLHITDETIIEKIKWLGFFSDEKINMHIATPAQALQKLLEEKWKLENNDKDMCVMLHVMEYELDKKKYRVQSNMVATGDDELHTAMAKTVGLPLGIAAKLILTGELKAKGVVIPVEKNIYDPVLNELKDNFSIVFNEIEKQI